MHRYNFFAFTCLIIISLSRHTLADISLIGADPNADSIAHIPEWSGGLAKKEIAPHGHHPNPFSDDQATIIDSNNYLEHVEFLSPGLVALIEQYPKTFYIPLYPSRRSSSFPDWYYQNMKEIETKPSLNSSGNGIINPIAGTNFPQPKNGLEAIWNHLTRWRGFFMQRKQTDAIVYPNGLNKSITIKYEISFEIFRPKKQNITEADVLLYYTSFVTSPPKLAGGALLAIDYVDQQVNPRQTWSYDSNQRRVKRLPYIKHDHPAMLAESIRTTDDTDLFSGSTELYNWKLIGKKVKYIPYNSYALTSPAVSTEELLTPYHVNPELTRYEAHRVWVIEATLKKGEYHIYPRRTFYLDEDSWAISLVDQYDQQGNIWRVSTAHLKNFYEVPMTMTVIDVYHDLKTKYYHVGGLTNEEKNDGTYLNEFPPQSFFSPAALRGRMKH